MNDSTSLPEAGEAPACSADGAITSQPLGTISTPSATETLAANGAAAQVTVTRVPSGPVEVEVPDVPHLSYKQRKALALLLMGRSATATAAEVVVDRSTLFRWRTENAHFIAFVNAWCLQSQQSVADNVQLTAEEASRVVLEAVRRGDVRAALAVLKATGSLTTRRPGPLNPLDVLRAMKLRSQQESSKMLRSRMNANSIEAEFLYNMLSERCKDQDDELQAELGTPIPPDVIAARKAARAKESAEFLGCTLAGIRREGPTPPKDQEPQK